MQKSNRSSNEVTKQLSHRFREWRGELGLTQSQLAEKTKISLPMIKKYEIGAAQPGSEALAALARTGLNVSWLLTGDGWMRNYSPSPPASDNEKLATTLHALSEKTKHQYARNSPLARLQYFLSATTDDPQEWVWPSRNISLRDCQRLIEKTYEILNSVAKNNSQRLALFMINLDVIESAFHLAYLQLDLDKTSS